MKSIPDEVLEMYPDLRELREEIPGRVSDPNQRERVKQEMRQRDPRLLSAEAQMIWRIADSYIRKDSAREQVAKILK